MLENDEQQLTYEIQHTQIPTKFVSTLFMLSLETI